MVRDVIINPPPPCFNLSLGRRAVGDGIGHPLVGWLSMAPMAEGGLEFTLCKYRVRRTEVPERWVCEVSLGVSRHLSYMRSIGSRYREGEMR